MAVCKKCSKPLSSENEKYCAICYSKRSELFTKIVKGFAKALSAVAPIIIAIIVKKPPKKL